MIATNPNPERIKHRKLRIAFSAVFGILCLLLIMLWVRSFWWIDALSLPLRNVRIFAELNCGVLDIQTVNAVLDDKVDWSILTVRVGKDTALRVDSNQIGFGNFRYGVDARRGDLHLTFPLWSPAFALAVLSAALWIHWRFSLRTLLIATTVVAALLGAVAWAIK